MKRGHKEGTAPWFERSKCRPEKLLISPPVRPELMRLGALQEKYQQGMVEIEVGVQVGQVPLVVKVPAKLSPRVDVSSDYMQTLERKLAKAARLMPSFIHLIVDCKIAPDDLISAVVEAAQRNGLLSSNNPSEVVEKMRGINAQLIRDVYGAVIYDNDRPMYRDLGQIEELSKPSQVGSVIVFQSHSMDTFTESKNEHWTISRIHRLMTDKSMLELLEKEIGKVISLLQDQNLLQAT